MSGGYSGYKGFFQVVAERIPGRTSEINDTYSQYKNYIDDVSSQNGVYPNMVRSIMAEEMYHMDLTVQ